MSLSQKLRQLVAQLFALVMMPRKMLAQSTKKRNYVRFLLDEIDLTFGQLEDAIKRGGPPSQALPDQTDFDIDLSAEALQAIEEEGMRPPTREERTCQPIDLADPDASPKDPTPADTSSPPKNGAGGARPPTG